MLIHNPFFLLSKVTFLRLWSACSSSSSCHAVSLAWAKGPTAKLYNSSSPWLPVWLVSLVETLPLWNSKDKKCCLCKTPYVAAPVRVYVTSSWNLCPTSKFLWMHLQEPEIFLGSQVMRFSRDLSRHIKTPMWNYYEEIYKQKWYQKGLLIALEEFHDKYLQVTHQGYSALMCCHECKP